jgi:nucleoid-associated protein YgaU
VPVAPAGRDRLTPTPVSAPLPPSGVSAPATPAGGRPIGQVRHWDEEMYTVQGGDNFLDLSRKFYGTEFYARALYDYNYTHHQTTQRLKQTGKLQVGETIFIPEKGYMEQNHGRPPAAAPAASPVAPIATGGTGQ